MEGDGPVSVIGGRRGNGGRWWAMLRLIRVMANQKRRKFRLIDTMGADQEGCLEGWEANSCGELQGDAVGDLAELLFGGFA